MKSFRQPDLPPDHPGAPLLGGLARLGLCEMVAPAGIGHGPLLDELSNMLPRDAAQRGGTVLYSPFARLDRIRTPAEAATMMAPAPAEVLDRIRAGAGAVVFDGASEGRAFKSHEALALHAALEEAAVPPRRVAWIQQNRALGPDYRAFCAAQGLEPMRIVTGDSYGFGLWRRLFGADMLPRPEVPPANWPFGFAVQADVARRHRWVCLNYIIRPHRAALAAWLKARPEPGFLSFSTQRLKADPAARERFLGDVAWLARSEAGLLPRVAALLEEGLHRPADTEDFGASHWRVYALPIEEVAASELFIVTETDMVWPNLRRWTEKTLKALATGLPFVVFGNAGTVTGLAEMGFDTLADLVDHGYDAEPAPDRRFAAALKAVARFLARPPGFTAAEMARLREAARHNREVFARRMLRFTALDPLEEVLATAQGGAAAGPG